MSVNPNVLTRYFDFLRSKIALEILPGKGSGSSLDIGLLSEAHGLISDMLADKATLPPHIFSGLQALSNLLTPPNYMSPHQQRQRGIGGAVVSLTDFSGSDTEENLPYTGERPSALPKRFKKNAPQSLLRRMSTSTWTTTTSATGMPTLEPEPCRKRSTSFRHPPELSPTSGMSNSLSLPASMSNTPGHVVPLEVNYSGKSRSFSTTATPLLGQMVMGKKGHTIRERERKTVCSMHPLTAAEVKKIQNEFKMDDDQTDDDSSLNKNEKNSSKERLKEVTQLKNAQSDSQKSNECPSVNLLSNLNLAVQGKAGIPTSDYDSCESPSGSETNEHTAPLLDICERSDTVIAKDHPQWVKDMVNHKSGYCDQTDSLNSALPLVSISSDSDDGNDASKNSHQCSPKNCKLPATLEEMENYSCDPLLDCMAEWDYPIFELELAYPHSVLSQMCHRVFLEVGLFETFKIPMKEFLNYFHTLEGGYRNKPYHNRMHAADVLHAVYYLTSQAIPGFFQLPLETTEYDQGK
ncbi:cGMP-inhibited 3',5'-cyclic phosphodiesterase A [Nymphon striatum]|nr:cGMP-inhibited 3',5'-cyclic phosphodiesterase A [Nymphon striatum]